MKRNRENGTMQNIQKKQMKKAKKTAIIQPEIDNITKELITKMQQIEKDIKTNGYMTPIQKFKKDWETKDFSHSWSIKNGIYYTINGNEYKILDFWIHLKNYHLEKTEQMSIEEKIKYMKRIIPQFRVVGNQHFETFLETAPGKQCGLVTESVNYIVSFIQASIDDNGRYMSEKKEALHHQQIETKSEHQLKYDTIESIFDKVENIKNVIDLLIDDEILNEKGELIKQKYHILSITEALVIKCIIKHDVSITKRNKLLAEKLNVQLSDKTSRTKSKFHDELLTKYVELFTNLK